jgi:hypothetical protein
MVTGLGKRGEDKEKRGKLVCSGGSIAAYLLKNTLPETSQHLLVL